MGVDPVRHLLCSQLVSCFEGDFTSSSSILLAQNFLRELVSVRILCCLSILVNNFIHDLIFIGTVVAREDEVLFLGHHVVVNSCLEIIDGVSRNAYASSLKGACLGRSNSFRKDVFVFFINDTGVNGLSNLGSCLEPKILCVS